METQTALPTSVSRRKRRLLTADHLDGRTRGVKRARQLTAEFIEALGGDISEAQRQACQRAGMLCALSEDFSARSLNGETVSLDALLRLEGCARRAVQRLGLPAQGAQGRKTRLKPLRWR